MCENFYSLDDFGLILISFIDMIKDALGFLKLFKLKYKIV